MNKFISQEKVLYELSKAQADKRFETNYDFAILYDNILNIPAADVRPVVRAHWENTGSDVWKCSACGYGVMPWNAGVNYCSNCGAYMIEDKGNCKK